jgi:hypothetical protein
MATMLEQRFTEKEYIILWAEFILKRMFQLQGEECLSRIVADVLMMKRLKRRRGNG